MTQHEDIIHFGKNLDKMMSSQSVDEDKALEILKILKATQMSLEILTKTKIGITINNFRKCCKNDEVINLAKSLIKSWKKLLPPESSGSSSSSKNPSLNRSNSKEEDSQDSAVNEISKSRDGDDPPHDEHMDSYSSIKSASVTNDVIRLKCREMLAAALHHPEFHVDFDDMGAAIEDSIFNEFKNTDNKYKNRIRSRISNIKDTKNPQLRQHILLGLITPDRIAVMTSDEMASEEMKKLRAKLTKESIDDHQMAQQAGTKSDLFKCGKCGKRDTMYNQVQTRSADEPMTTFVLCNNCGNRWKFC